MRLVHSVIHVAAIRDLVESHTRPLRAKKRRAEVRVKPSRNVPSNPMGGSPPPGSKKGGYKPVVRSCVENINWLHFALLHVRDAATPARGRRSVDARDAKFVYTGHARGRQAQGVVPPALERDRVPAHAAARRPDHLHDEVPRRDARDLRLESLHLLDGVAHLHPGDGLQSSGARGDVALQSLFRLGFSAGLLRTGITSAITTSSRWDCQR